MLPVMEIIMPQQASGNVPAFLAKLWKMVDNPDTGNLNFAKLRFSESSIMQKA